MTYNKYNQNRSVNVDHSSLERKFPSMQAMIAKYIQNGNGKHQKEGDKHQSDNFDKMHANKPAAFKSGDR